MTKLNGLLLGGLLLALTGCQNDRFEDLENEVAMQQLIDTHQHNEIANLNAQLEATQTDLLAAETALAAAIADNGTSIVENAEAIQDNVTTIETNYNILAAVDSLNLDNTTLAINKLGTDLTEAISNEVNALNVQLGILKIELENAIADGDQYVINNLTQHITNVETQLVTVSRSVANVPTFDATALNNAINDLGNADEALSSRIDDINLLLSNLPDVAQMIEDAIDAIVFPEEYNDTAIWDRVNTGFSSIDMYIYNNESNWLEDNDTVFDPTILQGLIDDLRADLDALPVDDDSLLATQSALDALEAIVNANSTAIATNANNIEFLRDDLTIAEANIASLEAQILALEANVLITTNALSTVNEGLLIAQATIVEINNIIVATASLTTAQIDNLNALIADLESTITMLQSEIDQLQFSTVGLTEDEIFALRQPILLALRSTTASADNLQASIVSAYWDDTPSGKSYRVNWEITTPSNRDGFYYAKNASPSITNGLRQMTDEEFFRWVSELQVLLNSLF